MSVCTRGREEKVICRGILAGVVDCRRWVRRCGVLMVRRERLGGLEAMSKSTTRECGGGMAFRW